MQKVLRTDFLVVIGMVLASIPLVLFFEVRFLTSTLFFFVAPALFLFLRKPKQYKRLLAGVSAGILVAFTVDFIAEINGAWSWAPEGQLLFPNKLFGLIPVDVLIWYFCWLLVTIIFYEHFFEHEKSDRVSPLFTKAFIFFSHSRC